MATSPRPGVIQLDHPNVYMAAKEAQKDDQLRQSLNIIGNAIQERNRDIRYRRASGKKDDRYTTEDLVKQGLPKAWEGAKSLGSGIASVAEGAWGILKAPFTDEEQAPTTTEDYRTEVGEKTTSPLAETPTDIIDSPEQILNAPKITTEVDGLPSTQTAEPGVKVSFPMTVAGSVERSNLPDTVVPLPKKEEAPVQPQATLQAPKTPDWSEMYRLDPKRAEYDWTREIQVAELNKPKTGAGVTGNKLLDEEHAKEDKVINQKMADLSSSLASDAAKNGWTPNSPEYIDRYAEILRLNASKWKPSGKVDIERMLAASSDSKKLDLSEKQHKLAVERLTEDKKKNMDTLEKNAYDDAVKGIGDVMNKVQDVGAQLTKVDSLLNEAANGNIKSLQAANKILIQSLDNSAVMAGEVAMFGDQSWIGKMRSMLSEGITGNRFSKKDMIDLFNTAKAIADGVNEWVSIKDGQAQSIYKARGGTDVSPGISEVLNLYRAPSFDVMPNFPDMLEEKISGGTNTPKEKLDALAGPPPELGEGDF